MSQSIRRCRLCSRFQRAPRVEPRQFGNYWYDAVAARATAQATRVVHLVALDALDGWSLPWPPDAPGMFCSLWADMDWGHVDHVDVGRPIIFVTLPSGMSALIDGYHRITNARKTRRSTISVVILNGKASDDVRLHRRSKR